MKQKDTTLPIHKPINKSLMLTPEQEMEMARILEEWQSVPRPLAPVFGSGVPVIIPLLTRRQKTLWFIAGIGVGLALAWVALMIGILWVV